MTFILLVGNLRIRIYNAYYGGIKLKKRMFLIVFTVMISISLITTSTMAWFTGSDDVNEALFTTGNVKVTGGEPIEIHSKNLGNVNPGDCFVISWTFKNEGTKRMQLRTEIVYKWLAGLDRKNIFIIPAPVNAEREYLYDWVLHQEAEDKPLYAYLRGFPDGLEPGKEVELRLIVFFDGEMTDDDYQAEDFTLGTIAEAVQATHGAPSLVWGSVWDQINDEDYSYDYDFWDEYWQTFNPMNVKCYAAYIDDDDDPEDPGETEPGEFRIILNSTKPENGTATVDFHIHQLRDNMGNKVDGLKTVNYKILVNDFIVYEDSANIEFTSGNANNNIVHTVSGEKHDNWKVIAEINGITIESKEKKL